MQCIGSPLHNTFFEAGEFNLAFNEHAAVVHQIIQGFIGTLDVWQFESAVQVYGPVFGALRLLSVGRQICRVQANESDRGRVTRPRVLRQSFAARHRIVRNAQAGYWEPKNPASVRETLTN
jgi:hypothetical protein